MNFLHLIKLVRLGWSCWTTGIHDSIRIIHLYHIQHHLNYAIQTKHIYFTINVRRMVKILVLVFDSLSRPGVLDKQKLIRNYPIQVRYVIMPCSRLGPGNESL